MTYPQAIPGLAAELGRNHVGLEALGPELLLHLLRALIVHHRIDLNTVRMHPGRCRRRGIRGGEPLADRSDRGRRRAIVLGLVSGAGIGRVG